MSRHVTESTLGPVARVRAQLCSTWLAMAFVHASSLYVVPLLLSFNFAPATDSLLTSLAVLHTQGPAVLRTCHACPSAIRLAWRPSSIRGSLSRIPRVPHGPSGPPSQGFPVIGMIHSPPLKVLSHPPCPTSVLHSAGHDVCYSHSYPVRVHPSIIVIQPAGNPIEALCNAAQGEHGSSV